MRRCRHYRRRRPQTFVHAITSEQLSGFLSFLVGLMTLTCRLDYLIKYWSIFVVTLTLNWIFKVKYGICHKWSDWHETKSKHKPTGKSLHMCLYLWINYVIVDVLLFLPDFMHLWQTWYHVEHVCFFRVCISHACTGLWRNFYYRLHRKATSRAASDENCIKMIIFPFQCSCKLNHTNIPCRPCPCVHNTLWPCT